MWGRGRSDGLSRALGSSGWGRRERNEGEDPLGLYGGLCGGLGRRGGKSKQQIDRKTKNLGREQRHGEGTTGVEWVGFVCKADHRKWWFENCETCLMLIQVRNSRTGLGANLV